MWRRFCSTVRTTRTWTALRNCLRPCSCCRAAARVGNTSHLSFTHSDSNLSVINEGSLKPWWARSRAKPEPTSFSLAEHKEFPLLSHNFLFFCLCGGRLCPDPVATCMLLPPPPPSCEAAAGVFSGVLTWTQDQPQMASLNMASSWHRPRSTVRPVLTWFRSTVRPVLTWFRSAVRPVLTWFTSTVTPILTWFTHTVRPVQPWSRSTVGPALTWSVDQWNSH